MRFEPGEEVSVLPGGQVARQHLVQMVVAVDQAGQQNMAAEVEHSIGGGRQIGGWPQLLDDAVAGKKPRIPQLSALPVHGDNDVGILSE